MCKRNSNPDGGVPGTDLKPEIVEEAITDEIIDISAGVYDPRNPIYLATGETSTSIQIQSGNTDNGDCGNDYEEEYDDHGVLWVNPSNPSVLYDEETFCDAEYAEYA